MERAELKDQDTLSGFRSWTSSRLESAVGALPGLTMLVFCMLGLRVLERCRVQLVMGRVGCCRRCCEAASNECDQRSYRCFENCRRENCGGVASGDGGKGSRPARNGSGGVWWSGTHVCL